ncbi:MAG TPA: AAA family ATPase [Bacteroidia bacterium]|jgi:hypothetical protein|nr:AAA family ATPase [Bacteroidia bacterium]
MKPEIIEKEFAQAVDLTEQDGLAPFEYLRITDRTQVKQPVPVITINDEIISTADNITTISGASKSGKSAFTGILIAGAISRDGIIDGLDGVRVEPNGEGKAVLHFDTEQAAHKHQRTLRSIIARTGLDHCPEYLLSYNIRQLDVNECAHVTRKICKAAKDKFNGIHLVVIDGIADYIRDVNEPNQSNAIIKFIEELAIEFNCPVIIIVHTNPGSDKERGHLGSQCQRKSESVLHVKTEGEVSFVEPKLLRMAGKGNIPTIQFAYDREKGYHVYCGLRKHDEDKDKRRIEQVRIICDEVFGGQAAFQYKDALEAIMRVTGKAIATAKGLFTDMKVHEMIHKHEDERWRNQKPQTEV